HETSVVKMLAVQRLDHSAHGLQHPAMTPFANRKDFRDILGIHGPSEQRLVGGDAREQGGQEDVVDRSLRDDTQLGTHGRSAPAGAPTPPVTVSSSSVCLKALSGMPCWFWRPKRRSGPPDGCGCRAMQWASSVWCYISACPDWASMLRKSSLPLA